MQYFNFGKSLNGFLFVPFATLLCVGNAEAMIRLYMYYRTRIYVCYLAMENP